MLTARWTFLETSQRICFFVLEEGPSWGETKLFQHFLFVQYTNLRVLLWFILCYMPGFWHIHDCWVVIPFAYNLMRMISLQIKYIFSDFLVFNCFFFLLKRPNAKDLLKHRFIKSARKSSRLMERIRFSLSLSVLFLFFCFVFLNLSRDCQDKVTSLSLSLPLSHTLNILVNFIEDGTNWIFDKFHQYSHVYSCNTSGVLV